MFAVAPDPGTRRFAFLLACRKDTMNESPTPARFSTTHWSRIAHAGDPKLAEDMEAGNRYNAARAAALAGAGEGEQEPPPDEPERARWRKKAVEWLRADLARWSEPARSATPAARGEIAGTLRHWKADADLAGLRDPAAIAALPPDEQAACRALWSEVDALLAGRK
jgi:serine/threonine-protein kinase